MTLDEFGVDLFTVVKLCGSIPACQPKYADAVFRNDQATMAEVMATKKRLEQELRLAMDSLTDEEAAEVMRRYEWVTGL